VYSSFGLATPIQSTCLLARVVVLGSFLAVTDRQPVGRHAAATEVIAARSSPVARQGRLYSAGLMLQGMALDDDVQHLTLGCGVNRVIEDAGRARAERVAVEVEVLDAIRRDATSVAGYADALNDLAGDDVEEAVGLPRCIDSPIELIAMPDDPQQALCRRNRFARALPKIRQRGSVNTVEFVRWP
jgi:hypothetical protein